MVESIVNAAALQKIVGFENTNYAYLHGEIVWHGDQAVTNHPRNAFAPWQPKPVKFDSNLLALGAYLCLDIIKNNSNIANKYVGYQQNLLQWLINTEISFPLNLSAKRFDAIEDALVANNLDAFKAAAVRVLGLGTGLTPSGDDFVGGIFFALAHSPRPAWAAKLPAVKIDIHTAAKAATNVISAALLDDMMAGCSYSVLHDVLFALHSNNIDAITTAVNQLLQLGASSGADMLAGLLLALTTQHNLQIH